MLDFKVIFIFKSNMILSVAIELHNSMPKILRNSITIADDRRQPCTCSSIISSTSFSCVKITLLHSEHDKYFISAKP